MSYTPIYLTKVFFPHTMKQCTVRLRALSAGGHCGIPWGLSAQSGRCLGEGCSSQFDSLALSRLQCREGAGYQRACALFQLPCFLPSYYKVTKVSLLLFHWMAVGYAGSRSSFTYQQIWKRRDCSLTTHLPGLKEAGTLAEYSFYSQWPYL